MWIFNVFIYIKLREQIETYDHEYENIFGMHQEFMFTFNFFVLFQSCETTQEISKERIFFIIREVGFDYCLIIFPLYLFASHAFLGAKNILSILSSSCV